MLNSSVALLFDDIAFHRDKQRQQYLIEKSLIGFLDQSRRLLKPVFVGDTLYPVLEVDEPAPNRSTGVVGLASIVHNQPGEGVLEGRQRYLPRRRGGAGGTA
jgi:hypothetical protein